MRMRLKFFTILLILESTSSLGSTSQVTRDSDVNDTTGTIDTSNQSFIVPKYGYLAFVGFTDADSVNTWRIGSFEFGYPLLGQSVALEWHFSMVNLVRLKAPRNSHRLASTPFLASAVLGATVWTFVALGDTSKLDYVLAIVLAPISGPYLALRPMNELELYTGIHPDWILFTEDDGILFQYQIGLRVDLFHSGLSLSAEAVKNRYWGYERKSETFGWGFGLQIACNPRHRACLK